MAVIVLVGLVDGLHQAVCRRALEVLGSCKLHDGHVRQAKVFLEKAMKRVPEPDRPAAAAAEADLGLSCLALGDADHGLFLLRAAQRRFEAASETEDLLQSLENEVADLHQAGLMDREQTLREPLTQLQHPQ